MSDWRLEPAHTVESVLYARFGVYPPSIDQLVTLLGEHHYKVEIGYIEPCTNHKKRKIYLSSKPQCWADELLHETSEVLLRLPVAPEFNYIPTGYDENHNVSCLVTSRGKQQLITSGE